MSKMIFILSAVLLLGSACTQDKTKANGNTKNVTNHMTMNHNVKTLDVNRMKEPYTANISGKVEVYDDGRVAIIENWTSRSRVDLNVIADSTVDVKKYKDRVIKVKGVIKKSSMWSGTIKVLELIEVIKK